MPVPIYRWGGDSVGQRWVFHRMVLYVVVRETVPTISLENMERLRELNGACEVRIKQAPFLLLERDGQPMQSVSLATGTDLFDPDLHPVIDVHTDAEDDILFLSFQSPVTTYRWRGSAFSLESEALLLSSVMCMPRRLHERDIPFFLDRRHEFLQKQFDNGRLVLDDGLVASVYETRRLTHKRSIPYAAG
jgi:hypothetical protein